MIRLLALAAVAAALIVAAAGCGGGSSDSSSGGTTTAASGGTDTNGGTSDGMTTVKTSSGSSNTLAKSCLDFAGASSKISQAIAASSSGGGDTADLKAYFAALADKAPKNLKSDFETLATAIGKYLDALKKAGFKPGSTPTADQIQKLQTAVAPLSSADVQQASKEIQTWVNGGCKS